MAYVIIYTSSVKFNGHILLHSLLIYLCALIVHGVECPFYCLFDFNKTSDICSQSLQESKTQDNLPRVPLVYISYPFPSSHVASTRSTHPTQSIPHAKL